MRKRRLTKAAICMTTLLTVGACAGPKTTISTAGTNIPYHLAQNYFFNNDALPPSDPRITSQGQFESLFGMAAFMGKGGEVTRIDFDRQFVIAVVLPETNEATEIKAVRLTATGRTTTLTYQVNRGAKQSYSIRPIMLVVADKKHDTGKVILQEE